VNAGLRYQFSPGGRGSIKDGPSRVAYGYDWTGPYIGAFVGSTWGHEHWHYVGTTSRLSPDFAGYATGGQAGYNLQFGRTVLGVEVDYGSTNAHGGISCPNALFFGCEADVYQLATVTGRVGVTWGRALFYAKGGLAVGEVGVHTHVNDGTPFPPSGTASNGETRWQTGWTVGAGMEFAVTDRWSARAEYMHYDLGKERFAVDLGQPVDVSTQGNLARIGINYHFHPRPEPVALK